MNDLELVRELRGDPPDAEPAVLLSARFALQREMRGDTRRPGAGRWRLARAGGLAALLAIAVVVAQNGPPAPDGTVNDAAGILDRAALAAAHEPILPARPDQYVFVESIEGYHGETYDCDGKADQSHCTAIPGPVKRTLRQVWSSVDGTHDGLLRDRPAKSTGAWNETPIPFCPNAATVTNAVPGASGVPVTNAAPATNAVPGANGVPVTNAAPATNGAQGANGVPGTNQPGTNGSPTNQPGTNQPATNQPPTNQPPTNQPANNQPPADNCTPRPAYLINLPTSAPAMTAYLRARANETTNGDLFTAAGDLIREAYLPPAALSALFQALGDVPDLTVAQDAEDAAGRHGVSVGRDAHGFRNELIFDRTTFAYLGSRTIALEDIGKVKRGTVDGQSAQLRVAIVDRLRQLP